MQLESDKIWDFCKISIRKNMKNLLLLIFCIHVIFAQDFNITAICSALEANGGSNIVSYLTLAILAAFSVIWGVFKYRLMAKLNESTQILTNPSMTNEQYENLMKKLEDVPIIPQNLNGEKEKPNRTDAKGTG